MFSSLRAVWWLTLASFEERWFVAICMGSIYTSLCALIVMLHHNNTNVVGGKMQCVRLIIRCLYSVPVQDTPGISEAAGSSATLCALSLHKIWKCIRYTSALSTSRAIVRVFVKVWRACVMFCLFLTKNQCAVILYAALSCVGISDPFLVPQNNSGPGLSPRSRVW